VLFFGFFFALALDFDGCVPIIPPFLSSSPLSLFLMLIFCLKPPFFSFGH
jgi:hypothetical protein